MNKRGSHVGIILSLVIFVTFLIFIFTVIEPRFKSDREFFIEYLRIALNEVFVGELNTLTLNVTIESQQRCINLQDVVNDLEEQGMDPTHLIIKNDLNEILTYRVDSKNLKVDTGSSYEGFLKIYYSEELSSSYCPGNPSECDVTGCSPSGNEFTIEVIRIANESFEPRIGDMVDWYTEDYEGLKNALNIPEGMEFEFSFSFENNEEIVIEATQPVPGDTNVYVQEIPIVYYDEWGTIKPGFLILKIWESS